MELIGNENWPTRIQNCIIFGKRLTLLPTLVPKEFAVSLAPIAKANTKAMRNPTTSIHSVAPCHTSSCSVDSVVAMPVSAVVTSTVAILVYSALLQGKYAAWFFTIARTLTYVCNRSLGVEKTHYKEHVSKSLWPRLRCAALQSRGIW